MANNLFTYLPNDDDNVDATRVDLVPSKNNSFFAVGKSVDHPNKNKIQIVTVIPNDLYTVAGILLVVEISVGCTSCAFSAVNVVDGGWRALYRDGGDDTIMVNEKSRDRKG